MNNNLRKTIYENFLLKETDELVEIWVTNDRVVWSDTAFEVIQEILEQQLDELPPQNEPIFEYTEHSAYHALDKDFFISKFTDPDNAPLLYNPLEILRMNSWLNQASRIAVVLFILISNPELSKFQRLVMSYFSDNPQVDRLGLLIAIIYGGLAVMLEGLIYYFSLKALAHILNILMEMEFNSRDVR